MRGAIKPTGSRGVPENAQGTENTVQRAPNVSVPPNLIVSDGALLDKAMEPVSVPPNLIISEGTQPVRDTNTASESTGIVASERLSQGDTIIESMIVLHIEVWYCIESPSPDIEEQTNTPLPAENSMSGRAPRERRAPHYLDDFVRHFRCDCVVCQE